MRFPNSLDDCPAGEGTPYIVSRDLSAIGWSIYAFMYSNRLPYKMAVFNDAHACKRVYSSAEALSGVILLSTVDHTFDPCIDVGCRRSFLRMTADAVSLRLALLSSSSAAMIRSHLTRAISRGSGVGG